jgi:hypothetical protein
MRVECSWLKQFKRRKRDDARYINKERRQLVGAPGSLLREFQTAMLNPLRKVRAMKAERGSRGIALLLL